MPQKTYQDSRKPGQGLNPGPPKYGASVLTTGPGRSVYAYITHTEIDTFKKVIQKTKLERRCQKTRS
jgi:hypothetical protein